MIEFVQDCLKNQRPAALLTIKSVAGSVPRDQGTMMLVTRETTVGTIGGGHLEWQCIAKAREILAAGNAFDLTQRFALGPSLGQCCGGALEVQFERLSEHHLTTIALQTKPLFRLHLFGAGHVGRALVHVLSQLRCTVNWIDQREAEFLAIRFANVTQVAVDSPELEVDLAAAGDYFVIMTHQHALDMTILQRVLARGDAGFIGLIGSQTKRASFDSQLRSKGLSMDSVTCPIGLSIGHGDANGEASHKNEASWESMRKEPGVIALGIAQQLLNSSQTPH